MLQVTESVTDAKLALLPSFFVLGSLQLEVSRFYEPILADTRACFTLCQRRLLPLESSPLA